MHVVPVFMRSAGILINTRPGNFLEKQDSEKPGGGADLGLSPRFVGTCGKKAAISPPFLHPAFAIVTGFYKHLFTKPPLRGAWTGMGSEVACSIGTSSPGPLRSYSIPYISIP
jgi:hypothetical protein